MGCGNVTTSENEKQKDLNSINNINNDRSSYQNDRRQKAKNKMRQEMKEYQRLIKRKRKNLNQNGEIEDTDESEDSRLKFAKGKDIGKKRKKLTQEEIEDWIKQDKKEENKRKGRKAHFSPMQKEVPFKHREPEGKYDKHSSKPFSLGYEDEIYRNINYGKPLRLYDQTWLAYDIPVEPDVYNPKYEEKFKMKISISTISRVMKNHLNLHYLKTTIKNKKLIRDNYIFMSFLFLKGISRALFLKLNLIYIDETGFILENNNFRTWRSSNDELIIGPEINKKIKMTMIIKINI